MAQTQEKGLKRKIITTARQVLLSDGYHNFSLRKVARKSDVSATSIYLHFENKDDLVHTLMDETIRKLNNHLKNSIKQAIDPIEKLNILANRYVNFALENPREYQLIYVISSEEMSRYPKEKFRKARKGYEMVTSVLEDGVRAGLIDEKHPRLAAYIFWAQLHGVMSVVLSKRLDTRIDQKAFIKESIDHIINGYKIRTALKTE
ncbi:MAG TPA: TetR/AcrR family transcriptional regulator [Balneolaceae bacterium]|nr:TetR/AcrR family transcriptional regulator [Balneolaceae bacterium]